jgi:alkanesulfonate monooxygenase SsuD/methylene tetrahydromethanopterin reductase-like flavin-dependent oxidoreductase (luciferase family)
MSTDGRGRVAIDGTLATRPERVNEARASAGVIDWAGRLRDAHGVIALGVQTWSTDVAAVERFWRVADDLGYARITYGDGLWSFTHDGWTMLGALALATRHARIGPAVTYAFDPAAHHPSWLAKRAITVDHLSRGRLDLRLAVGAGDAATRAAWERHGIRYPDGRARVAALEVALDVLDRLLRGERVEARGPFGTLCEAGVQPPPIQTPRPPIWIAAMRPQAVALTARRADGWEASYVSPAAFAALSARLDALLHRQGRAPHALRRSVEVDVILAASSVERERWIERFGAERGRDAARMLDSALVGDADVVAARIAAYQAAGATDLMLGFVDFPATTMLERLARDVVPRLATVAGAGIRADPAPDR